MKLRLTGTCVLVLGIFAFAGSALAGNGNGNGNGNDGSPGNSENAPGQVKKDTQPEATTTPAPTTTTTTSTTTPTAATDPAPTEGVKPSNTTAHETHAPASSNETKKYGNDQTAGGIAIRGGAKPDTKLHGPGNSQPHKAAPCGGGHEVDVHALKAHRGGTCGSPTPAPNPTPTPDPTPTPHPTPTPEPTPHPTPNPPSGPKTDPQRPADPGTQKTSQESGAARVTKTRAGGTQGVLAVRARAAELPFTGIRLWLVALVGLTLVAAGVALRKIRFSEAAVELGHDHPDRARLAAGGSGSAFGRRSRR
jgi:hypothetical protein